MLRSNTSLVLGLVTSLTLAACGDSESAVSSTVSALRGQQASTESALCGFMMCPVRDSTGSGGSGVAATPAADESHQREPKDSTGTGGGGKTAAGASHTQKSAELTAADEDCDSTCSGGSGRGRLGNGLVGDSSAPEYEAAEQTETDIVVIGKPSRPDSTGTGGSGH